MEDLNTEVLNDTEEVLDDEEIVEETPAASQETPTEEGSETTDLDNVDPNKLPPELQKLYKGMQGSYTKKMQALEEALNGFTPHKERLALLDRAIQGDPEARSALARIAGVQQQTEKMPDTEDLYKDVPEDFEDTKSLTKFFDNRVQSMFQEFMQSVLPEILQQHLAPVNQISHEARVNKVNAEIERLRGQYKDFDQHIAAMIDLRKKNPTIELEDAYKLVSWRRSTSPEKIVSKPGASPRAVTTPPMKAGTSWEEAAHAARSQIKRR